MKTLKRISFGCLIVMLAVLATATVVEKTNGTPAARAWFYDNIAFVALWTAIAVSGLCYMLLRRIWKRPAVMLLHLALLIILCGAGITWFTALHGKMQVMNDQAIDVFTTTDGTRHTLPFTVTLESFDIQTYPGTPSPMDFVSRIQINDADGTTVTGTVSMNKVFSHRGYRFYQSGYDAEGRGAVFTVAHDPWGIGVTYVGYGLLLAGMIAVLIDRRTAFRALLRHPLLKRGTLAVILFLTATFTASAQPRTLPRDVADNMGNLYILHNNRICPFQTFARQFTAKLCGKTTYKGLTAEQVASGWIFYYDDWKDEPMIKVKNGNVRRLLGIDGKYASLEDFYRTVSTGKIQQAIDSLQAVDDQATIRALGESDERYQIANMVAAGTMIKLFPLNHGGKLEWYSHGSLEVPHDIDDGKWLFLRNGMDYLYEMVSAQDWNGANQFITKLKKYQTKECGDMLPSDTAFRAEKLYNSMEWDRPLSMALATLGIILFIITCRCVARSQRLPRGVRIAAIVILALSLAYLTTALILRWIISGHVPMSNGFETMQFMAWATMALTLLSHRKLMLILPFGILTAGLALMVASFGESNPQITQLMPVLASPLLSIHVAVIMVAYALLAFLMLGGVLAFTVRRDQAMVERLHVVGQVILYPAVFLLTAGVFIGAVWANVSWGTYWSWDPKETWALITLIVYALPLHNQSLKLFSKPMFFHGYCIIAFLSVLITYFGVNFILGGMHSYA
ncbi:MAG: cytochrome c biogenesis protein CcsA [Muribaculaceae bacterium]|nr:cytochrome c biogenesis protein CcsA [Muribaculaceae bacterium]